MEEKHPGLSVESLLSMSPMVDNKDLVALAARQLFMCHVKNQPAVHDTFFPKVEKQRFEDDIDSQWFDFDKFSSLYVCEAICNSNDSFKIHTMLQKQSIQDMITDMKTGPKWKKLGFALYTLLFPDLVKDYHTGNSFRAFMESDREHWADELAKRLRDSKWMYSVVHPVVKGRCSDNEYNRDMNLLFVKLHLLDPKQVMPAFTHLRKVFSDLNLELVTTNYLGEPPNSDEIKTDVEAAINKQSFPKNSSRLSLQGRDIFYGVEVIEFIMNNAKYMGVWTGRHADNKRTSTLFDGCDIIDIDKTDGTGDDNTLQHFMCQG